MVLSGPPTPNGGSHSQSIPPSMLRSNSGLLGTQRGLVSSRNQYSNMDMLGNVPNVPSFTNQSFGNGGPGPGSIQRGGIDTGAESDQHSGGNGMGLNAQSLYAQSNHANPGSSGQVQGQQFPNPSSNNQIMSDQQRSQQLEHHNFQHGQQQMHQFSSHHTQQQHQAQSQQQQQFQSIQGGLGGVGPVKLEPQATNVHQQQHLQSLRNLGPVKFEPQQTQTLRNFAPVKMEPHHADDSLFLHQQQQQQQISNQSSQAAAAQINLLHQQRLLQLHQHQQQQLLKGMPQQRSQLQQQFQQQGLPLRSPVKPVYEPGMCARRLTHYMYQQQHRPEDNSIEFWRKFVAEYYAPHAKKKWCVSLYGNGRQTTGVFPQDVWQCEICNRKPGRGFEATAEVLPRLFKIKYESGTLEELLYVDMPREYQNSSGQIILDYAKAIQESVFEQLRVVRDGQLRIVFSPDLKICSWEFCARRHEELIPRRLLVPQVSQLGAAAQKYQAATQIASSSSSNPELQSNCNMFVASARQLAKALDVPLVNDLGYTKRYVRCLQISEVVNSMKDLIDYSREIGTGPMESLAKFPRKTTASSGFNSQAQQGEDQLQQHQQQTGGVATSVNNYSSDCSSVQTTAMQIAGSNGVGASVNNSASTSANTIVRLLHQSSMNSRQQSSMNNPYGGSVLQAPSPGSSTTLPQAHPNSSPTPSSSNNNPPLASHGALNHMSSSSPVNMPMQSGDADTSDQSSVQKILHQVMMSSQLNGGNDAKNGNGISATGSNSSIGGSEAGFSSNVVNGMRAAMANNSTMSGRVGNGMTSMAREQNMKQQQDPGNQLLGFNNLQFDWKTSL